MKNVITVTEYDLIPKMSIYLGSEHGDGSIDEFVVDGVADAINPICFKDSEGVKHYFDRIE